MNCKFFQLDPHTIQLAVDSNLTKTHKLFLSVNILNNSHYFVSRENNMIQKLNKLDRSKIILLTYHYNTGLDDLDLYYISIKEWNVQIVPLHSNIILNNYNCIYTDNFKTITDLYQKDKITVVFSWDYASDSIYDKSLKQYMDILILVKPFSYNRILESKGIPKIIWGCNQSDQYFRLNGKKVTLH